MTKYGKDNFLSVRETDMLPQQKLALSVSELWLEVKLHKNIWVMISGWKILYGIKELTFGGQFSPLVCFMLWMAR